MKEFLSLMSITSDPEQRDSRWSPTVLVLGPGGVKGFLELGALLVFEREKYLERIQHYVGVSVGAVISLLLVAGYSVTEIIAEAFDVNIFQDISSINISEARANSGLISNRGVKDRLLQRMEAKFGFIPTLQQLYVATGLVFTVVTMNLDRDCPEYISKNTDPTLSAVDAVMLSMNIPLLFYKLRHKNCVCIDGAFGDPYPVCEFDDGNTDILGIYIVTKRPGINNDSNFLLYLYKIIDSFMTYSRVRNMQRSSSRVRHLELCTPTFDTVGLTVDAQAKNTMIMCGYREAEKFLPSIPPGSTSENEVIIYDGADRVDTIPNSETGPPPASLGILDQMAQQNIPDAINRTIERTERNDEVVPPRRKGNRLRREKTTSI